MEIQIILIICCKGSRYTIHDHFIKNIDPWIFSVHFFIANLLGSRSVRFSKTGTTSLIFIIEKRTYTFGQYNDDKIRTACH